MIFKGDTKKILDFFDNKELQDIFNKNFIHKQKVREAIDELARSENTKFFGMLSAEELEQKLGL